MKNLTTKVAEVVQQAVQDASVQQGKGAESYARKIIKLVQKAK